MNKRTAIRRFGALAMTAALSTALFVPTWAADQDARKPSMNFDLSVNGASIQTPAAVMVPARSVGEALGFTVTWLGNGSFVLDNGEKKTTVTWGVDSYQATSSRENAGASAPFSLGIPPYCANGVSYVPLSLFEMLSDRAEEMFTMDGNQIIIHRDTAKATAGSDEQGNEAVPIAGGWARAESPVVTKEVQALLDKGLDGLVGVSHIPVAYLGSQIVAGTNHAILCRVAPVVPNAKETYAIVYLYEDLDGKVQITKVEDSDVETKFYGAAGSWYQPDSPAVTKEVQAVFDKAFQGFAGVNYTPVAVAGCQTVSGTNYCILCESTVVVPNAETTYSFVYLYENLDGSCEITDIVNFHGSK